MALVADSPRKVRRISRACDYCHHRSIRCRVSEEGDGKRCQNCLDFNQACTYDRPAKRRGVKARPRSNSATSSAHDDPSKPSRPGLLSQQNGLDGQQHTAQSTPINNVAPVFSGSSNPDLWRAPHVASQALIMDLVEVYFEIIYPM